MKSPLVFSLCVCLLALALALGCESDTGTSTDQSGETSQLGTELGDSGPVNVPVDAPDAADGDMAPQE
ncbi:MAG: hypothetical protein D6E12_06220, partial [Desulfovibrio sp.]